MKAVVFEKHGSPMSRIFPSLFEVRRTYSSVRYPAMVIAKIRLRAIS